MNQRALRVLRRSLWPLSVLYGGGVRLRNAMFDRAARRITRLPVPVLSVGNLTVGGTGKTPMVIWLVRLLRDAGLRPGVLARGYGRAPGALLNDEGAMLAARFPELCQEQDPDRVAGGQRLVERGVDVVVLDDGFQHRRLHRDVDLVCADARAPFADGMLLPAGDLRESASGLRRARAVVLTRAAGLDAQQRQAAEAAVRRRGSSELEVFFAAHQPRDVLQHPHGHSASLQCLRGQRVALCSAIAKPASFEQAVADLGAEVVWSERRRDHHRFTEAEQQQLVARAQRDRAVLLVTEKDHPKFAGALPRWVLRVDLEFLGHAPSLSWLGLVGQGV